jgi:hypothetical protein
VVPGRTIAGSVAAGSITAPLGTGGSATGEILEREFVLA